MWFIIFSIALCPCILNIYGWIVRLVRCNVSTDRHHTATHWCGSIMHRSYRPIDPQEYIGYRLTRGKARSTCAPVVLANYRIENSNCCPGNVMHKPILKPTNTLSKSSSTNVVTIRPADRTIYAKSLSDSSTLDLIVTLSTSLVFVSTGVASYQSLESTALIKCRHSTSTPELPPVWSRHKRPCDSVKTLRTQDTSDPRHFGTIRLVLKCPDSSAPVPKCLADISALVPNCLDLQQTFFLLQ